MTDLKKYLIEGVTLSVLEAYNKSLERHVAAVREAGEKLGVPTSQLDIHDDSKGSMEEFPYYARQFHGDRGNPTGFCYAWLHHIHANPHHWQHWIFPDNFTLEGSEVEEGGVMEMPDSYILEMIADWMGSSYVYTGSWDMTSWLTKNRHKIILHENTNVYVKKILAELGYEGLFKSQGDK